MTMFDAGDAAAVSSLVLTVKFVFKYVVAAGLLIPAIAKVAGTFAPSEQPAGSVIVTV